jgi:hypothetical protein
MDFYVTCVAIGAIGLIAMALGGLGRHGHGSTAAGSHAGGAHGHGGHGMAAGAASLLHGAGSRATGWLLMSPRLLFAGLIGFGLVGSLLRHWVAGVLLLGVAIAGGIAFERLVVAPLWNFTLRFASSPALTLDSVITADATAVTSFDRNGQGIIAVEVDGQVRQVLATLAAADRSSGAIVRAGQRVRIEEVDSARHRCLVSLL